MDLDTFIVATYCLVDEAMDESLGDEERLRKRGPNPTLDDREVLTIELVGEFLGIDTDEGIYRYFRRHYDSWFPALGVVHRTTFARQAANLWKVKELLWRALLASRVEHDPKVSLVDSFAVPVCSFAKAPRCKGFAGEAAYGHDAMNKGFFYGFRAHLKVCWPGVIVAASLAPANEHDRWVVERAPPVAEVADRRQTQDRDGSEPARRALSRQAGAGQGPLAPHLAVLEEGSLPHLLRVALPARGALAIALLGVDHPLNLHTGSATVKRAVGVAGPDTTWHMDPPRGGFASELLGVHQSRSSPATVSDILLGRVLKEKNYADSGDRAVDSGGRRRPGHTEFAS